MASSSRCIIHIGYHKTASSYLQEKFFVPDNRFSRWPDNQFAIHPALISLGPYETVSAATCSELEGRFRQAQESGYQFVVSHERLSGHPSSGGYDAKILAQRMHSLFPTAKILIIFREQCSVIRSAYSQFVTEGGSMSLYKYLHNPEPGTRRIPLFSLAHFEFAPAIRYYQELFGSESVMALPFEMFVKEPIEFLNRIGRFSQEDGWRDWSEEDYQPQQVNVAKSVPVQTFRRILNACFVRRQFSNSGFLNIPKLIRAYDRSSPILDRFVPKPIDRWLVARQKQLVSRRVGDHYVLYNQDTAELTGIDLSKYGYQLP